MLEALRQQPAAKAPRKRGPRKTATDGAAISEASDEQSGQDAHTGADATHTVSRDDDSTGDAGAPARKRRRSRSRRKPGNDDGQPQLPLGRVNGLDDGNG
jgi:hypothetical protein